MAKLIDEFEKNYENFVASEKKKTQEKEQKPIRVRSRKLINY